MYWTALVRIKGNGYDQRLEGNSDGGILLPRIFSYISLNFSRAPRTRSTNDDTLPRRVKTPIIISPEIQIVDPVDPKLLVCPSNFSKTCQMLSTCKGKGLSPEKRLKALSTESLRSVSPGSDSVFYSEADGLIDHQVKNRF